MAKGEGMLTERECCICKTTKPITEFHKDKSKKLGYRAQCKACIKDMYVKKPYNKERYKIRYTNIKKARSYIDELEKENDELRTSALKNLKNYLVERNKVDELEKRLK